MTKPGRKPKPTAQKRLAGNPGRRPLNEDEPTPSPDAPDMPDFFDAAGRAAWEWLVGELRTMEILATSDKSLMTRYCVAWSQFVLVTRELVDLGKNQFIVKSTTKGTFYVNPLFNVQAGLDNRLARIEAELGLSPTSRTRIQTSAPEGLGPVGPLRVVGRDRSA